MVKLAIKNNPWLSISEWEALQKDWTLTVNSLSYHKDLLESQYGKNNIQLMLLCGGDLMESFMVPNLWKSEDVTFQSIFILTQELIN
jgi:nicotinamide mononucleotide adenylyltransferase